jgi:hypothetical protein
MFGLKINFVNSKLYGLNVDPIFLEAGSSFCRADPILSLSNSWESRLGLILEGETLGNQWWS